MTALIIVATIGLSMVALAVWVEIRCHIQWLDDFSRMPSDEQERLAKLWHQ